MKLTIRPLTPDLWPALEDLFGENGACYGCWCMYWRIGSEYRKRPSAKNKAAFREVVAAAAADAGRAAQVVTEWGHPPDHPTALAHAEGEYLKVLLLRA